MCDDVVDDIMADWQYPLRSADHRRKFVQQAAVGQSWQKLVQCWLLRRWLVRCWLLRRWLLQRVG